MSLCTCEWGGGSFTIQEYIVMPSSLEEITQPVSFLPNTPALPWSEHHDSVCLCVEEG